MPPKPVKLTKEQQALLNARKAEALAGISSGPSKEELKAKREAAKAAQEARKAAEESEKEAALALELAEKLKLAGRYAETAAERSEAAAKKAAHEAEESRLATAKRFELEEQKKKAAMKSYKNTQKWKASHNGQAAEAKRKFGVANNWAHGVQKQGGRRKSLRKTQRR
jgi:hypothetical protein